MTLLCNCGPPGPGSDDRGWCAAHDPIDDYAGFLGLGMSDAYAAEIMAERRDQADGDW